MIVIKAIYMVILILYTLCKIANGAITNLQSTKDRIMNLIEIIVGIVLTFILYKI